MAVVLFAVCANAGYIGGGYGGEIGGYEGYGGEIGGGHEEEEHHVRIK